MSNLVDILEALVAGENAHKVFVQIPPRLLILKDRTTFQTHRMPV